MHGNDLIIYKKILNYMWFDISQKVFIVTEYAINSQTMSCDDNMELKGLCMSK